MAARDGGGVRLEKRNSDRRAFGDDGEEVASGEGEKHGVGFADGAVGAGRVVEERFVSEKLT